MMFKKIIHLLLLLLLAASPCIASDGEDPYSTSYIEQTIVSLENDLEAKEQFVNYYETKRPGYIKMQSEYNLLLFKKQVKLYEQNYQNIFSLASTYKDISTFPNEYRNKLLSVVQLDKIISATEDDLARIDSLKKYLEAIDTSHFPETQKEKHQIAITRCNQIIKLSKDFITRAKADCKGFENLQTKIDNLGNEAGKLKTQIENTIIKQSPTPASYIGQWETFYPSFKQSWIDTYTPDKSRDLRGMEFRTLYDSLIIGLVISIISGWFLFGKFFKKILKHRGANVSKPIMILVGILLVFSIYLASLDSFIELDYYKKITALGPEFLLTIMMVIFALAIRLDLDKFWDGMKLYLPMIIMSAVLISLRLTSAPNIIVRVLLPLITPIVTIGAIFFLSHARKDLPRLDKILGAISMIFLIIGTILTWSGYAFIAFISLLFWNIMMCCILLLVTLSSILKHYQIKLQDEQKNIKPWLVPFCNKLFFPYLAVVMIVFSLYWPMEVFDMGYSFVTGLETHNVAGQNIDPAADHSLAGNITPNSLIIILLLGITVNYLLFLGKTWLQSIYQDKYEKAGMATLVTLGSLVVWIIFVISSLFIVKANFNGIFVILGGMSLGLGLALKDTMENLISGISMMFGRLRQGDMVEFDGVRGKVLSQGYRTTYIEALDGSIIGFQNTQLFNKNFRNLTQNDNWEKVSISIGVAYNTDFEKVSEIILEAIRNVDQLSRTRRPSIFLDDFGDNAIIIKVVVSVPVDQKGLAASRVREEIYKALNENDIVIPFPQQDIYVKELPSKDQDNTQHA